MCLNLQQHQNLLFCTNLPHSSMDFLQSFCYMFSGLSSIHYWCVYWSASESHCHHGHAWCRKCVNVTVHLNYLIHASIVLILWPETQQFWVSLPSWSHNTHSTCISKALHHSVTDMYLYGFPFSWLAPQIERTMLEPLHGHNYAPSHPYSRTLWICMYLSLDCVSYTIWWFCVHLTVHGKCTNFTVHGKCANLIAHLWSASNSHIWTITTTWDS